MNSRTTKALPDDPNMYHVQTRSVLISKLPVEIRNIIWTYLPGSNTLHLFYDDANTLRSCKTETQELRSEKPGLCGYFETTKILYSTSTFELSDCWTHVSHLQWSIPVMFLIQISQVTVTVTELYASRGVINYPAWKILWMNMTILKSLTHLRVQIVTKDMENFVRATITAEELNKIENELLEYARVLEDVPGRRKAILEIVLVLPRSETESGSNVAKELTQNGWKITRA
ncbi:hypothetical protein N0V83_002631 [Neocucurbitaria cava]|uniref:DUF7730 domain-containing protein n=1 Tax=Neocucurbitaria cava TaxID=798079 RepID=A0A9W9CPP5_9PLEO|nr:hypothetical protein N0V83_002631 [Neocucurbitaria cava]